MTTYHVVDVHLDARLYLEANNVLLAVGDAALHFLLRQSERVGHLAACMCVVLEVLNLGTLSLKLFRRVESDVSLVGSQQLLYIFLIYAAALALSVRTMFAAEAHALVELDAEPAERFDDILLSARYETVGVGVLDAEYEVAAVLASEEIVVQCCAHATDVQCSCWTWCETHPHFSI